MTTPSDPLFSKQWHLNAIGDIQTIWDSYTGAGVRVVVYDDGVEAGHADLAANYDASPHFTFDGVTYKPDPQSRFDGHGTSCAGLIAAVANNGVGGTGVAFGASITGLDYLNSLQYEYNWIRQETSPLYDAAMRWAASFDIMSNSWGSVPDYTPQLNLNRPGNSSAVDAAHYEWISANGRGGLGTIIVKAAGNDSLNCNGDGSEVSRHTITIAATNKSGFAAGYSNFGSSLLVTAPAASVTTDLTGESGFNRTGSVDGDAFGQIDYTTTFNGTSAATPVVAGVVALMLEANPDLGWRDVQSILAMSASHIGSAVNSGPSATEVGQWLTMGGNQWNGGGAIYHQSYGFGMVDAYAAVRMAEGWSRMHHVAQTSRNERHLTVSHDGAPVFIADKDENAATPEARVRLHVSDDMTIDSVQVTLTLAHSRSSDLVISLRGPSGAHVMLSERDLPEGRLEWTFAGEAFRGMSSQGDWTLTVHDRRTGQTGHLNEVRLDFYGSSASNNDVHTFTDDFGMLAGLRGQSGRQIIEDLNGGIDWLNFAAIADDLAIKMVVGGAIAIGGSRVATFASAFERLHAGDGNDRLTGNARDNLIFAARGDDLLFGGRGDDLLLGRSGDDALSGQAGKDRLAGGWGADTLTGGDGRDVFVFFDNFGRDLITDWTDNHDSLQFDDAIWGGGLTVDQMVTTYGAVVSGSVVLDFGASGRVTLQGATDLAGLLGDITII